MTLKGQSVKSITFTGASTAIIGALNFFQMVVLARLIKPSDFGLMGMVNVVVGFAGLFADMGIGAAIIQRQDVSRRSLSTLYWLNVWVGFVLFGLLLSFTPVVVRFYKEPRLGPLLVWASLLFLIAAFGQQFQVLREKELEFGQLAKIEIVAAGFGVLTAVWRGWAGAGAFALVGGALANTGARTLILVFTGFRRWRPSLEFGWQDVKGYLTFGFNYSGQRSFNYISANIDFMLIGRFLGAQALGYYTLAYNLANLPSSKINAVISRVFFPVFSRLQDDIGKLKSGYLRMQEFTSMVNIPILFGMAVVAPLAIPLFFGPSWHQSVLLLQVLSVVGLARSIAGTVGPLLLARGRTDVGFKWSVLLAAMQIPGIYLGVRSGSALGVAIAFAVLQCLYLSLNYLILVRKLLGPCLKEYILQIWPSFWMSIVMALPTMAISTLSSRLSPPWLLAVSIVVGASLYFALAWYRKKPFIKDMTQLVFNQGNV